MLQKVVNLRAGQKLVAVKDDGNNVNIRENELDELENSLDISVNNICEKFGERLRLQIAQIVYCMKGELANKLKKRDVQIS